jgi:hypothetical protein
MAAAYEVTLSLTDSETFRFTVPLVDEDGTPLPLEGLAFEYVLWGCGESLSLDEASGISVDLDTSIVTVAPDPERRLSIGTYQHGFRSTDENDITTQHFDGDVTVTKGGFSCR